MNVAWVFTVMLQIRLTQFAYAWHLMKKNNSSSHGNNHILTTNRGVHFDKSVGDMRQRRDIFPHGCRCPYHRSCSSEKQSNDIEEWIWSVYICAHIQFQSSKIFSTGRCVYNVNKAWIVRYSWISSHSNLEREFRVNRNNLETRAPRDALRRHTSRR